MGERRRYTMADVRRSYTPEKHRDSLTTDWMSALFYRPISFWFTLPLLNLGISANAVTVASTALACALPMAAAYGGPAAVLWVGGGAVLWAILDCVDGNIARVTQTSSRLGGYLDLIGDLILRACLYGAVGILADFTPLDGVSNGLAIGLLATIFTFLARLCRIRIREMTGTNVYKAKPDEARRGGAVQGFLLPFVNGLDRLLPLAVIAAAAWTPLLWAILAWLLFYSAIDFIYTQASILKTLSRG